MKAADARVLSIGGRTTGHGRRKRGYTNGFPGHLSLFPRCGVEAAR
jgi:hypothetical protein